MEGFPDRRKSPPWQNDQVKNTKTSSEPLSIRSYAEGFGYPDIINNWARSVKSERLEPISTPNNSNSSGDILKKFAPNILSERVKTQINSENSNSLNTKPEISTDLMMAKILKSSKANEMNSKLSFDNAKNIKVGLETKAAWKTISKPILNSTNKQLNIHPNIKSKHLSDLSMPMDNDAWSIYSPISLPFMKKSDHEETTQANTSMANLLERLMDENRHLNYDDRSFSPTEFVHIQLPFILPELDKAAIRNQYLETSTNNDSTGKTASNSNPKDHNGSNFTELPEGKLGKIIIHESGRVQMKLSSHLFDLEQGSDCSFSQEVGCYFDTNSEFIYLGRSSDRIVLIPQIQDLIKQSDMINSSF